MMICIKCHKTLEAMYGDETHPVDGIICQSHGNYGSTVFDSISLEEYLVFFICDECLEASKEHILVKQQDKPFQPFTTYEG